MKDPWESTIVCSKLFSRLATQGAVDCRPPIKVPYTFRELVQNNCMRLMANVSSAEDWKTEWSGQSACAINKNRFDELP